MNRFSFPTYLFAALLLLAFTACDSTEPDDDAGEGELITRVVLTLQGDNQTLVVTADDPDGDGVGIQTQTLMLTPGATYTGRVEVFNDLASDPDERVITTEIEGEAEEHQFFYTVDGLTGVTVDVTDQDANGLPVGLAFGVTVASDASGTGTLNVVLSHYDDAPKNGVDRSDETDIDVTFPLAIQ